MNRKFRLFCLLTFCAAMAGCVKLEREYPEVRLYRLIAAPETATETSQAGPVLTVRSFSASPSSSDANFLLVREGNRVEKDFYNRFAESPAELLTAETTSWLRAGGAFSEVRSSQVDDVADWTLAGHLIRLEGDFSTTPATATMAVQYFLIPTARNTQSRYSNTYEREVTLARSTPDALVDGWNEALTAILQEFETDLRNHLAAASAP